MEGVTFEEIAKINIPQISSVTEDAIKAAKKPEDLDEVLTLLQEMEDITKSYCRRARFVASSAEKAALEGMRASLLELKAKCITKQQVSGKFLPLSNGAIN